MEGPEGVGLTVELVLVGGLGGLTSAFESAPVMEIHHLMYPYGTLTDIQYCTQMYQYSTVLDVQILYTK